MYVNLISKKRLVFSLSIGEYMSLIGKGRALWKKKNPRYKKLISEFLVKIVSYSLFSIFWLEIKNMKNSFFLMLNDFKKLNYKFMQIKDISHFTKIKSKKKTYLKRRITRKLIYLNPLKV